MVRRRIETTPSEQLVALRKARDRYVALADQLKDDSDAVATRLDDRQRERDARRIASAYEKSIANMAAKMVRAGTPSRTATLFNNLGMARPVFAVAVGLLAFAALIYPGFFRSPRANIAEPAHLTSPIPAAQPRIAPSLIEPAVDSKAAEAAASNGIPAPTARRPPAALRSTSLAEQIKPGVPFKMPTTPARNDSDEGFVTKVLQPDGTFKEEHFTSAPR